MFEFKYDYYAVMKELPKEEQSKFLYAILEYVFEKKEPNLSKMSKAIWNLIVDELDRWC